MAEQFANLCTTTIALGGYTAGSGVLDVATTAAPWPQTPSFHIIIVNPATNAVKVILNVTAVNSATQWAVTAEGTDANALAGDAVLGTMLTAAAIAQLKTDIVVDILSDTKPVGAVETVNVEQATLAAGATNTVLNYTGGQPGYIRGINVGFTGATDYRSVERSLLKIYYDGEASPTISVPLSLMCAAEYGTNAAAKSFKTKLISYNHAGATDGGFQIRIPIPFSSGIKIEITNGSPSDAVTLWARVSYSLGVPNTWDRTRKLRVVSTQLESGIAKDAVVDLINVSEGRGRLLGIYWAYDGYPGNVNPRSAPLEGDVNIYRDGEGSASIAWAGTEDLFNMHMYFGGYTAPYTTDEMGLLWKDASAYFAYRLFLFDPIIFESSLYITWNCGESSQVNFTGTATVSRTVWYYTET